MWFDQRVSVIVPCYREARLVGRTLARIPAWVDHIHVVDDASDDGTREAALAAQDPRVEVLSHVTNRGVGAAIVSGYRRALAQGSDLLVVMAGDDQMDPEDLPQLLRVLCRGEADYAKGNRFRHQQRRRMPLVRRLGGRLLSIVTNWATGLRIQDSQCGYTAVSARALSRLPLETLWPRFGYPNDLLGMLAARDMAVQDVVVRPVYADERSGIRFWHLLLVLYVIWRRYLIERYPSLARAATVMQDAE